MEVGGPELHPAVKGLRCRGRALPCGKLETHVHPGDCCLMHKCCCLMHKCCLTRFSHRLAQKVYRISI